MLYFKYKKKELFCEGVKVAEICKNFNTPFYLYSSNAIINNYKLLHNLLKGINFLIAYSVKANSNLSVLKTLAKCGAGADVVSIGELKKALAAAVQVKRKNLTKDQMKSTEQIKVLTSNQEQSSGNFQVKSFLDLINLAEKNKELELKYDLERNVKLINFVPLISIKIGSSLSNWSTI